MTTIQVLVLGLVQGVTEILPISSDGHLAVVQFLLATPEQSRLALTAALHLGTGLALVGFFAPRLGRLVAGAVSHDGSRRAEPWRLVAFVGLATLPAVAAGLALEDRIAGLNSDLAVVGVLMMLNGGLLLATRFARVRAERLTLVRAIVIGLVQVAALLPGISRSGTTIAAGLLLGLSATEAFEFSFLLAIPATIGAGAYELLKLDRALFGPAAMGAGIAVAFAAGLGSLYLLRTLVAGRRFYLFSLYCGLAGAAVLLLGLVRA